MTQTLQTPLANDAVSSAEIRFIVTQKGQPQFAVIDYDLYLLIKDQIEAILVKRRSVAASSQPMAFESNQAWYWTPEWQAGEAEAVADLQTGRSQIFDDVDAFIGFLDSADN